jgi:hypothetical protein
VTDEHETDEEAPEREDRRFRGRWNAPDDPAPTVVPTNADDCPKILLGPPMIDRHVVQLDDVDEPICSDGDVHRGVRLHTQMGTR